MRLKLTGLLAWRSCQLGFPKPWG